MLDFLAFDASRGVPMYFDLLANVFWVVEFLQHMDFKRDLHSFKKGLFLNSFGDSMTIHLLLNQDLGFSDPPTSPFVITFSTECNQKLPFSDPP